MCYEITIGGRYRLAMLEAVEIQKSVDILTCTAAVTVPAIVYNQALKHEDYAKVGDAISIKLGYDDNLVNEFDGYIQRIDTDDDTLTFNCEDNMYLTRKPVEDKQFTTTTIKAIAHYCLKACGLNKINCDYDITYEKFVISKANAFDVFKKLKEETKATIYFVDDTLHIHPPFVEKGGTVVYDFAVNVESSDLKYRRKDDRKITIEINSVGTDGKKTKSNYGTTGGEIHKMNVTSPMSKDNLTKVAETEFNRLCFDGYEGSVTGWLIPFVLPSYSAKVIDGDYEFKTGTYYVTAVQTNYDENGGTRKVTIGKKLS